MKLFEFELRGFGFSMLQDMLCWRLDEACHAVCMRYVLLLPRLLLDELSLSRDTPDLSKIDC